MRRIPLSPLALVLALVAFTPAIAGSQIVYSVAGANGAAIAPVVDAFRLALGPLNPNVASSFLLGRREINWDGVPDSFSTNNLPGNFFNVNSPRGIVLSTPGTGFDVSANAASGFAIDFGDINPTYASMFESFSPQRLFTAVGSNITDVTFFLPGTTTPAFTTAFGVVFSDVDLANTTSLQFFDLSNNSLGTFYAPAAIGDATLSFLGLQFALGTQIGRVRIISGNGILSAGGTTADLVVMDDFIYAEPMSAQQVVPEPTTLLLLAGGLAALGYVKRRRTA